MPPLPGWEEVLSCLEWQPLPVGQVGGQGVQVTSHRVQG